jgi:hypothetical protein
MTETVNNFQLWISFRSWIIDFFFFMVLALYLDNVLPKEHGVKQPFYYFLTKKYWVGEGNRNVSDERKALLGEVHDQEISRNDNFEEVGDIVRELEKDNNCLQVNNLTKVYPNGK